MTIISFNAACAGDARYTARFDAAADLVANTLAAQGLTLNPEDRESLKAIGAVKLAVFGLEPLDAADVVDHLPGVRAQLRQREVVQQLDQADSALHADLKHMSRAARLSYGRELEAARAVQRAENPPAGLSAEAEAAAIKTLRRLPAAARIATARAMGLI